MAILSLSMFILCVLALCPVKGFAVFVFHVVRHEKVWKKIRGMCSKHSKSVRSKIASNLRTTVS